MTLSEKWEYVLDSNNYILQYHYSLITLMFDFIFTMFEAYKCDLVR